MPSTNYIVTVHDKPVRRMVAAVTEAVSPIALQQFMSLYVSPYFEDQIIARFAAHGSAGTPGGTWAPLEESTKTIRRSLGYSDDDTNERTGELMHYVAYTRDYGFDSWGVWMSIPEGNAPPELERKLRTAQEGWVQGSNDLIPGAVTPPRPVLALEAIDELRVHQLLHMHVAHWLATHA